MKELENKLAQQVDDRSSVSPTDNAQVDHLLKRHQREVSELNQQIDDAKQRQEAQLKHKLEAKKLAKERCAQMRRTFYVLFQLLFFLYILVCYV